MELVIDANILFSALIKDGITTEILFESNLKLFSPDFLIEEYIKYENMILKKTSRTREGITQIMHMLKKIITVVPKEEYSNFMKEADNVSPDKKDVMYFALALKLNIPLWSNDKKLKEQDKIMVYSTEEILGMIRK